MSFESVADEIRDVESVASNLENFSFAESEARPAGRTVSFANSSFADGDMTHSFARADSSPAMKASRPAAQRSQNSITRAIAWAAETSVQPVSELGTPRSLFMPKKMKVKVKGQEIEQENAQSAEVAQQLENVQDDVHRVIQLSSVNSSTKSEGSGLPNLPEDINEAIQLVNQFRDDLNERQLQLVYTSEIGRQLVARYKVRGDELTQQMDAADAAEEELRKQQDYNIVLNNELQQMKQENRQLRTRLLYLEKTDEDCKRLQQEVDEKTDIIASLNANQVNEENTKWEASELSNRWRSVARDMAKMRSDKEELEQSKKEMSSEIERKAGERVKEKLEKERRLKNLALQALKKATEEKLKQQIAAHELEKEKFAQELQQLTESNNRKDEEVAKMNDKNDTLIKELELKDDELVATNRKLQQEASKQLDLKLAELNKKLSDSREEIKRSKDETQETRRQHDDISQELLKEKLTNEQLQTQIEHTTKATKEEQQQLKTQLESAVLREQELSSQCSSLQDNLSSLELQLSDQSRKLNQQISSLKNELVTQTEEGSQRQQATSVLETECDELKKKISQLVEEKEETQRQMDRDAETHRESINAAEARLKETTSNVTEAELEMTKLQQQLASQKETVSSLELELQKKDASLTVLQKSIEDDASHKIEILQQQLADTTQDLELSKQKLAHEAAKFTESEESHAALAEKWKSIIDDQRTQLDSVSQSAHDDALIRLKTSEQKATELQQKLSQLRTDLEAATQENNDLKSSLSSKEFELKTTLAEREADLSNIQNTRNELSTLREQSNNTIQQLTASVDKLQSDNTQLTAQIKQSDTTYKDSINESAVTFSNQLNDVKTEYQGVISKLRDSEKELQHQLTLQQEANVDTENKVANLELENSRLADKSSLDRKMLQNQHSETIADLTRQLDEASTTAQQAKATLAKTEATLSAAQAEISELKHQREADTSKHQTKIDKLSQDQSTVLSDQRKLQDSLTQAKQTISQLKEELQNGKRDAERSQSELEKDVRSLRMTISNLEREVKSSEERCKQQQHQQYQTDSLLAKQKLESDQHLEQLNTARRKLQVAENDITRLEEIRKTNHTDITQLESKCILIEGYLQDEKDRNMSIQRELTKHQEAHHHAIKSLETEVEHGSTRRNRDLQQYQQQISSQEEDAQNLIAEHLEQINKLRDQLQSSLLENAELTSRISSLQLQLKSQKNTAEASDASVRRTRGDLTSVKDELQLLGGQNKSLQQELIHSKETIQKLEHEKQQARSEHDAAVAKLEQKMRDLQTTMDTSHHENDLQVKSLNAKVKSLLDAKEKQSHKFASLEQELENELEHQSDKTALQQQQTDAAKRTARDLELAISNKDIRLQDLNRSVARERAKVAELEQTIAKQNSLEVDLKNEIAALIAAQRDVVTSTEDAKQAMMSTLDQANEEHSSIRREIARHKQMATESEERNNHLHEQVQKLSKSLLVAEAKIEEAERTRESLTHNVADGTKLISSVQHQLDSAQAKSSEHEHRCNTLELELQEALSDVTRLKRNEQSAQSELENQKNELTQRGEKIRQLEQGIRRLEEDAATTEQKLRESEIKSSSTARSTETYAKQLEENSQQITELTSRLQEYDELLHDKEKSFLIAEASCTSKEMEIVTLTNELTAAQNEIERHKQQVDEAVTIRDGAEVKSASVEKQLHDAREEAIAQRRENNRLQQEMEKESLTRKSDKQQNDLEISKLQKEIESLRISLENEQLKSSDLVRLKKELDRERARTHQAELLADRSAAEQRKLRADVEQVTESTARALEATVAQAALDDLDQKSKLKLSEDTVKRATSQAIRSSEIASDLEDRYRRASAELGASRERVVTLERQMAQFEASHSSLQQRVAEAEVELRDKSKLLQDIKINNYELQGRLDEQSKMYQAAEQEVLLERGQKNLSIQRVRLNRRDHDIESDLLRQEIINKNRIITENEIASEKIAKQTQPRTVYTSGMPSEAAIESIRSLKVIERSVEPRSPTQSPPSTQSYRSPVNAELSASHQKLQHSTVIIKNLPEHQRYPSMNPIHVSEGSPVKEKSIPSIVDSLDTTQQKADSISETTSEPRNTPSHTLTSIRSALSKSTTDSHNKNNNNTNNDNDNIIQTPITIGESANISSVSRSEFFSAKEDPPQASIDAHAVSSSLHKAMQGLGTDEDRLYSELSKLQTPSDWSDVRQEFQESFPNFHGGDLRKGIEDELTARELAHARSILRKNGIRWDSELDEESHRSRSSTSM